MAIQEFSVTMINGDPVACENPTKIEEGSITRKPHAQIGGKKIITGDHTTNYSTITINVRATKESTAYFRKIFKNGDNNTISHGDQNFTNCALEKMPDTEDLGTVDYVFFGDPVI